MSRIASKDDVCRYLLESEGGLSRAIAADVGSDGAHDTDDRDYSIRQQPKTNIDGPSGRHSPAESLMESMNDARPMSAMLRYLLESAPQFRRVQEIVDRCVSFSMPASPWSSGRVAHRCSSRKTCTSPRCCAGCQWCRVANPDSETSRFTLPRCSNGNWDRRMSRGAGVGLQTLRIQ